MVVNGAGAHAPGPDGAPAAAQTVPVNREEAVDLALYQRWFRAYETNKKDEMDEAQLSRRYYHSKQWTDDELKDFDDRNQPVVTDNAVQRKIDALVGVEQRMRRDPKAYPRGPGDEGSADVATASMRFACDINRWPDKASDCAHDGMVSGIGVIWVGANEKGGQPEVMLKHGQPDRFFYDSRSVEPDFSDAAYMGMHLWLDIDDAKAQWPDKSVDLDEILDQAAGLSSQKVDEDRAESWGDFEHRRVRVIEMYHKRMVTGPLNNSTSQTPAAGVPMEAWFLCKFAGHVKLEAMWSPYVDEHGTPDNPYVAWSPYVDEKGDRYSPVRAMRPMQDEVNHRRSKFLHLVNTRQMFYREGDIADVEEMAKELTKPDGKIKHQGEWGKTVGIIDQNVEMQGQAELLAQAQARLENYGPNPGVQGRGGGVESQSGRAILAQRDSGMTELSPVFERLRDWKLRVYRKVWARIRQTWTAQRFIRLTDDPRAPEFLGINQIGQNPATGAITAQNMVGQIDVDIILDEGPDTIIMQEEMLQTLAQLGESAMGPLGKIIIELSNMPNKERLQKMIDEAGAPPPEVAALQQRMAKLEEMLRMTEVEKKLAETGKTRADTLKTLVEAFTPHTHAIDHSGRPKSQGGEPNVETALDMMNQFEPELGDEPQPELPAGPPNPMQQGGVPPNGDFANGP